MNSVWWLTQRDYAGEGLSIVQDLSGVAAKCVPFSDRSVFHAVRLHLVQIYVSKGGDTMCLHVMLSVDSLLLVCDIVQQ